MQEPGNLFVKFLSFVKPKVSLPMHKNSTVDPYPGKVAFLPQSYNPFLQKIRCFFFVIGVFACGVPTKVGYALLLKPTYVYHQ